MLTREEEDIAEMEADEKNTEILRKWVEGKEDKRYGTENKREHQGEGVYPSEGSGS